MEVSASMYNRATECKTDEQKKKQGRLGNEPRFNVCSLSPGVLRGVSPTIGKALCVVNFLTRSASGTRNYTVHVVALLVME